MQGKQRRKRFPLNSPKNKQTTSSIKSRFGLNKYDALINILGGDEINSKRKSIKVNRVRLTRYLTQYQLGKLLYVK